jgi:glucose/arabinose dehydrogenase
MRKAYLLILILIFLVLFLFLPYLEKIYFNPQEVIKEKIEQGGDEENSYEVVFENLEIPWSIVFLDNDKVLITERLGRVKIFSLSSKKLIQEFQIKEVKHTGEGGLLGSAVHPNFSENNFVYFYYTTEKDRNLINRVERYKLVFDNEKYELIKDKVIVDNIPAGKVHNGGRIKFGEDDYLYITTGDAGNSENAQDINSLSGKILRVKDDGGVPEDNPFNNLVYAYGIRNSQGITWDEKLNLWSIDHGRSGFQSGLDEINLIEKGKNYGWPIIQGDEKKDGMEGPVIHSGPDITWAPADLLYYKGNLFFTGLRGQGLYQYNIKDGTIKVHFFQKFGRLRALTLGSDDNFYLSTSNRDGRGFAQKSDDIIIKVNPIIILGK